MHSPYSILALPGGVLRRTRRRARQAEVFTQPLSKALKPAESYNSTSSASVGQLLDWDLMAAEAKVSAPYPTLDGMHGNALIQDKVRQVIDLLQQSLEQAVVIAEGTYEVLSKGKSVKTARPLEDGHMYADLEKQYAALKKHINDPSTIDEYHRRKEAERYTLPPSIFTRSFAFIENCMRYSCSFDERSLQLLGQYKQELAEHSRGLYNFFDSCSDRVSATQAYTRLRIIKDTFFNIARTCAKDGYQRAEAAVKARKAGSSNSEVLQILREVETEAPASSVLV